LSAENLAGIQIRQRRVRRSAGFTLLEAIVAVAIVGLALVPIVSFLSLSANELIKAGEANERSFATQAVVALLDSVNPGTDASGSLPVNDRISVSWESEVLVRPGQQIVSNSGLPNRHLGFYKMHVIVTRAGDRWFDFDLRKVGYTEGSEFDPFGGQPK
jgi:prepilin-type N-terminal cleavage/methylation domain-containing protein